MIKIKKIFYLIVYKIKTFSSKRRKDKFKPLDSIEQIVSSFRNRNELYSYFHHHFWNDSELFLKSHRNYFKENNRGFGEDAFHSMWYYVFKTYKPKNVLEIGVYRGQTLTLFQLLSKHFGIHSEIHGISPFASDGDEVSNYLNTINYLEDVKSNFAYFNIKCAELHKGFSNEVDMINIIKSKKWDLIYIDGNHDYEVAKYDFDNCANNLNTNGIIVLDDSALYTDYIPTIYSTGGHPGPSRVALEIDSTQFVEIFSVGHNRIFQRK
jgi:predicted O-methyltransferase YrrM